MRWRRAAAGLIVVALTAACDVGSIRRPAPAPTASPTSAIQLRHSRVPVPDNFVLQVLTFVDSRYGYALYTRGTSPCEAVLFSTVDGGRSWNLRRHPQPVADGQQMIVGPGRQLLLLSEPYGWYYSVDGGQSFRRFSYRGAPPMEYYQMAGRFQFWQSDTERGRIVEYAGGRRHELAAQPPLAKRVSDIKYDPAGRLWVVDVEDGRPVVALSRDRGHTWQRQTVPGQVGWVIATWLDIAPGGGDVWLAAQSEPGAFPLIWRYDGSGWREQPVAGHPAQLYASAAIGDGVLAITRPGGGGLIDQRGYRASSTWPLDGTYLRMLPDGTLISGRAASDGVYLGLGYGLDRRWVQITLESE